VRTLVKGKVGSGYHRVYWDGRDDSRNPVSPGVYFYHIRTDDFSTTRKMIKR